jgi:predicted dithiol-disulfide oxidoreductase (DUF899 family)
MQTHRMASHDEWLAARKVHLAKEKELTRLRDKLNAERRELPWVRVEKIYVFDTRDGKKTLAELFEGRSQLIVQHFMFGPDWAEGCIGCSFAADHIESGHRKSPRRRSTTITSFATSRPMNCRASVSFIRTRTATFSIPIRPTPEATSSSTRATCCST